jgi:hypothetical protein
MTEHGRRVGRASQALTLSLAALDRWLRAS